MCCRTQTCIFGHRLIDTSFDRPFLPWAFGFARQRVMAYRKTCVRSRLVFCDEALDIISDHCIKRPTRLMIAWQLCKSV